jgi:hypothetical protein
MELNPAEVKSRQFFAVKSFLHATFAANAAGLTADLTGPSHRHPAIPTLVVNCEVKRISPGNR